MGGLTFRDDALDVGHSCSKQVCGMGRGHDKRASWRSGTCAPLAHSRARLGVADHRQRRRPELRLAEQRFHRVDKLLSGLRVRGAGHAEGAGPAVVSVGGEAVADDDRIEACELGKCAPLRTPASTAPWLCEDAAQREYWPIGTKYKRPCLPELHPILACLGARRLRRVVVIVRREIPEMGAHVIELVASVVDLRVALRVGATRDVVDAAPADVERCDGGTFRVSETDNAASRESIATLQAIFSRGRPTLSPALHGQRRLSLVWAVKRLQVFVVQPDKTLEMIAYTLSAEMKSRTSA